MVSLEQCLGIPKFPRLKLEVGKRKTRSMIIADRQFGHWSAWHDVYPCLSFAGDTAVAAVSRLCEAVEIDPVTLAGRYTTVTRDRMEFTEATPECPDCHGSGKYTGLISVEDCLTCGGGGRV